MSETSAFSVQSNEKETEINIPGVDAEKGLSLYGDDMEIYLHALHSYATHAPASLDRLRNVTKETLSDYAIYVHGFKGINANIGAEKIREAAFNLEKMAKSGDLEGVLAENDIFIKEAENVVTALKKWLEQYDAKT